MRSPALLVALSLDISPAGAVAPEGYFELRAGITLESGDSWREADQHFRLFGVQACLRGTVCTDKSLALHSPS
jgi:hypothetical protein